MTPDFYICKHCNNMVFVIENKNPISCCGEPMTKLTANSTDASQEKHIPKVKRDGNILCAEIGSVFHPMTPEHNIMWAAVVQADKVKISKLGDSPITIFRVNPHADASVYAYCNLHGLWMVQSKGLPKKKD